MKKEIKLNELDIKCLEEMPLILKVLATTGNKLGRILEPITKEVKELIDDKLNQKKGWILSTKIGYEEKYFPFTSHDGKKPSFEVNELDNSFRIETAMFIEKKNEEDKIINDFWLIYGYKCLIEDDKQKNNFYFLLRRDEVKKNRAPINKYQFYTDIEKVMTENYEIDIWHPENGFETEWIELSIKEKSVSALMDGYQNFKDLILIPFLKTLK